MFQPDRLAPFPIRRQPIALKVPQCAFTPFLFCEPCAELVGIFPTYTDDGMIAVLEDHKDDPVYREITAFIGALTEDEQIDLVALAWLGRGDGTIEDWPELRAQAASEHNRRTAYYLLGLPLLPDYLEEGLSLFGESCESYQP